ncbi:MAG: NifB/NifX family molybdenum-iron cluster-binding protein [Pseudomonadota bacterium]
MLIAVTSQGEDLDAEVDPRFGRANGFLLVDPEGMSFKSIGNSQNLDLPQGAGIQSAQNIAGHHPDVVLTGHCGPKAFKVLRAAGIDVVVGMKGTISEAVRLYLDGKAQPSEEANVEGHWV